MKEDIHFVYLLKAYVEINSYNKPENWIQNIAFKGNTIVSC